MMNLLQSEDFAKSYSPEQDPLLLCSPQDEWLNKWKDFFPRHIKVREKILRRVEKRGQLLLWQHQFREQSELFACASFLWAHQHSFFFSFAVSMATEEATEEAIAVVGAGAAPPPLILPEAKVPKEPQKCAGISLIVRLLTYATFCLYLVQLVNDCLNYSWWL